jgi:myo-inositol-1(or 4)-monophosphatase
MDYKNICDQTIEVVAKVGEYIREEREKFSASKVEVKGLNNFVTHVDKNSEIKLCKGLVEILPEAGIIGEEGTNSKHGEEYNWIIDPVDGTTNFIHGLPPYAISVALAKNNIPVVGVILEVASDECFYAYEGGKAFLNGKEIKVSDASKLSDSLIATGFPYTDYGRMEEFMETLTFFMKKTHGLRRLGSAATDLDYVACGRFEGFYEYGLHAWDIAAGIIILKQAGGDVTDFNGNDNYLFGGEIVASNNHIHKEFLKVVHDFMEKRKK